jgi:hypothetical protein
MSEEIPEIQHIEVNEDSQLRCAQWDEKRQKFCNKMFCVGDASDKGQSFKCPRCGKFTRIKRLN